MKKYRITRLWPSPRMPVANEGLVRNPPPKYVIILMISGNTGRGPHPRDNDDSLAKVVNKKSVKSHLIYTRWAPTSYISLISRVITPVTHV